MNNKLPYPKRRADLQNQVKCRATGVFIFHLSTIEKDVGLGAMLKKKVQVFLGGRKESVEKKKIHD